MNISYCCKGGCGAVDRGSIEALNLVRSTAKSYRDSNKKEKAWQEAARELGLHDDEKGGQWHLQCWVLYK